METGSAEDFVRQSQQQQAVKTGHRERPRFRMRLKKDTGLISYVGEIAWTKGEEKRTDEGSQQQGENEPQSREREKKEQANVWEQQQGVEFLNATPPSSDHKNNKTQKQCRAQCLSGGTQGISKDNFRAAISRAIGSLPSDTSIGEEAPRKSVDERREEGFGKEVARQHRESASAKEGCVEHDVTSRDSGRRRHDVATQAGRSKSSDTANELPEKDSHTGARSGSFRDENISSATHKSIVDLNQKRDDVSATRTESKREKNSSCFGTGQQERDKYTEKVERNDGSRLRTHQDGSPKKGYVSKESGHCLHTRKERRKRNSDSHNRSKAGERSPASKEAQRPKTDQTDDKSRPRSRTSVGASERKEGGVTREFSTETLSRKSSYHDHTQKRIREGHEEVVDKRKAMDDTEKEAGKRGEEHFSRYKKEGVTRSRPREAAEGKIKRRAADVRRSSSSQLDVIHDKKDRYYDGDAGRRKADTQTAADEQSRFEEADAKSHFRKADTSRRRRSRSEEHRRRHDKADSVRERRGSSRGSRKKHYRHQSRSRSRHAHCQRSRHKKDGGDGSSRETLAAASATEHRSTGERWRSRELREARRSVDRRRHLREGSLFSQQRPANEYKREHGKVSSSHCALRSPSPASSRYTTTRQQPADRHPSRVSRSPPHPPGSKSTAAATARRSFGQDLERGARTREVKCSTKPDESSGVVAEVRSQDDKIRNKSLSVGGGERQRSDANILQQDVECGSSHTGAHLSSHAAMNSFATAKVDDGGLRSMRGQNSEAEYITSSRQHRHEENRRRRSTENKGEREESQERREYIQGSQGQQRYPRGPSHHEQERHRNRDRFRESWRSEWREEDVSSKKDHAKQSQHVHDEKDRREWPNSNCSDGRTADYEPSAKIERTLKDTATLVVQKSRMTDSAPAKGSRRRRSAREEAGRPCYRKSSNRDTRSAATDDAGADADGRKGDKGGRFESCRSGKKKDLRGENDQEGAYNTSRSRRSSETKDARSVDSRNNETGHRYEGERISSRTGERTGSKKAEDSVYTRRENEADDVSLRGLPPSTTSTPICTGERTRSERTGAGAGQEVEEKVLSADFGEGQTERRDSTAPLREAPAPDKGTSACYSRATKTDFFSGRLTPHSHREHRKPETSAVHGGEDEGSSLCRDEGQMTRRTREEEESTRQRLSRARSSAQEKRRSQEAEGNRERRLSASRSSITPEDSPGETSGRASKTNKGKSLQGDTCRRKTFAEEGCKASVQDDVSTKDSFPWNEGKGRGGAGEYSGTMSRDAREATPKENLHGRDSHDQHLRAQVETRHEFSKGRPVGRNESGASKHSDNEGAGSAIEGGSMKCCSQLLCSTEEDRRSIGAKKLEEAVKRGEVCGERADRTAGREATQWSPFLTADSLQQELSRARVPAAETGGGNSDKERLLEFSSAESHEGEESARGKDYRTSPSKTICSVGECTSMRRPNPEKEDDLNADTAECRPTEAQTSCGDRWEMKRPVYHEDTVSGSGSSTAGVTTDINTVHFQLSSCADVCGAAAQPPAASDSASFDSRSLPEGVPAFEAVGCASGAAKRSVFTKGLRETGVFVEPNRNVFSAVRIDSSCQDSLATGDAVRAGNENIGGTGVALSYSPAAASGSPLAFTGNIPELLKGLVTSLSLAGRGHRSKQRVSVCSQGQADTPPMPQRPGDQSDLSHSLTVPPQPFPHPKILTCAPPMQPQPSLPSPPPPPPPPPPSLALGATARQPLWDSPRHACPTPQPSGRPLVSACSASSSSVSFPDPSTSARATSELGVSASSVEERRTQVPASHSHVILSIPTRQPREESLPMSHTLSAPPGPLVAPAAATSTCAVTADARSFAEISSALPTSLPPASPRPPLMTPLPHVGVDSNSALQRLARGLAHSRRPVRNQALLPSVASKHQQETGNNVPATSAGSAPAAVTVAASVAADMDISPHGTAAATVACSKPQEKCTRGDSQGGTQWQPENMKGGVPFSYAHEGLTLRAALKVDEAAAAQEQATTIASVGNLAAADVSVRTIQTLGGGLGENLAGGVESERIVGRTGVLQKVASSTRKYDASHERGIRDSLRERTQLQKSGSQPFHTVGTEEPLLRSRTSQQMQEVQLQEPGACKDMSQPRQAFSREQLLGGVSIKRVKRTRQGQSAPATAAPRILANLSTEVTPLSNAGAREAEQQPGNRNTLPESGTVAGIHIRTPGYRRLPLNEQQQRRIRDAGSAEPAAASSNRVKVSEEIIPSEGGESRSRGAGESSRTHIRSKLSDAPRLASNTAAVADGKTETLPNVKHSEGTGFAHLQRRRAAEAASAAAAGAAAVVRQWQRDEQVARFLQELQARYTVLGDEEAATASASGAAAACSGSCQDDSSSDDSDTSNTSLEWTSSGRGSNSSDGRSTSPKRTERHVGGDQVGDTDETQQHRNSIETAGTVTNGDTTGAVSIADITAAKEGLNSDIHSSGTTTGFKASTDVSDTESSVSSFFSPSSSSSDSPGSSVSRGVQHPLRLLDQERRRFFRAAAAAACKLHLLQHSDTLSPTADFRLRCKLGADTDATVTSFEGRQDAWARSGAGAFSDVLVQHVENTVSLVESERGSKAPPLSVCTLLRTLVRMKKALRRAKWANKRAVSAQASAAAAVAAAAASGALSNYLLDRQHRAVNFQRHADRTPEASKKKIFKRMSTAESEQILTRSFSAASKRPVPCRPANARYTTSGVKTQIQMHIANQTCTPAHLQGQCGGETGTEKSDAIIFQRSDSRLRTATRKSQSSLSYFQPRSTVGGGGESRVTSSPLSPTKTDAHVRTPHFKSVATAAAVLQEMPKAQFTSDRVHPLRRHRRCSSLNRKGDTSARKHGEYAFCSKVFTVARRQLMSAAQECKCSATPSTGAVCAADSKSSVLEICAGPCRRDSAVKVDRPQNSGVLQACEFRFTRQTQSSFYKVEVTERSGGECLTRHEHSESLPVSVASHKESKMAAPVSKKLTDTQRTYAKSGEAAMGSKEPEQAVGSSSGRCRMLPVAAGDTGGVGASRTNTWYGSDVSSTRSSSTSRSPSLSSADDMYDTVDAGCAGLFLPTHTVEIGKKSSGASTAKTSLKSFSLNRSTWNNAVSSVAYHNSLALGAAGLEGGEVCVCSLGDMRPIRIIPSPQASKHCATAGTTAAVERVSWKHSAEGTAAGEEHLLAIGRRGGHVELLDVRVGESRRPVISWKAHTGPVENLKFLSTAACVTSSPMEMYVRFWDLRGRSTTICQASSVAASQYKGDACTSSRSRAASLRMEIDCAAQTHSGRCHEQPTSTLLPQSCIDGRLVRSVKMDSGISAFAVSFDEELLAVACLCGEVQVLSLPLGPEPCEQLLSFPSVHELDCFSSLSFSRNGRGLLVCGERQFTPRMRAATQLISYPFCEMWDLQDTKQRHRMLVCASFWKHLRRHGSQNRERDALAPVLPGDAGNGSLQHQLQLQEGRRHQLLQHPLHALPLTSLETEKEDAWPLTQSPLFELPLSFFPSSVAVSIHASGLSSLPPSLADSGTSCGTRIGELGSMPGRASEQWCARRGSRDLPRAAHAESTSYVVYLNSHLSDASRGTGIAENREDYVRKAADRIQISQELASSPKSSPTQNLPDAIENNEVSRKRNNVHGGLSLALRRQHRMPLSTQRYTDRRPGAKTTDTHCATVGTADARQFSCYTGTSKIATLNWAQDAARRFRGPLGGDFRWPCRRFVCDLWRDKVVGVGGALHLIGAFKQWDASTGYLDSCTVSSVSQDIVNSVAADPGGGPTLLTGGRSAVSGCGTLTMWGYFTVSQMEALDLVIK